MPEDPPEIPDEEETVFSGDASPAGKPPRPPGDPPTRASAPPGEIEQPAERFTLIEVLGEGAQGEVCRAFDNHLQRPVAIKFPHRAADEKGAREILAEARKAARLNHPNAVTIYECGFWKGRPFIAMELVDGVSLDKVIKECGRVSVERYLTYARQILAALDAAHRSGIIHRDLKPQNVLVARDGRLKLTDFGVAHLSSQLSGEKTVVGVLTGTPAYMAPEQWRGERPDIRSDIYAFACMSYKLLAGQNVFTSERVMERHLSEAPPPIRHLAPHVPPALERVLLRCLEKEPADRYQSAADVLRAIEAAMTPMEEDTYIGPSKPETPPKKRGLLIPFLIVAVVLGGLSMTPKGRAFWKNILPERDPGSPTPATPPKDSGKETPPPSPIVPPADRQTDAARETRKKALDLLARARDATDPNEAIRLAESAAALLAPDAPERPAVKRIVDAARRTLRSRTEQALRQAFEAQFQQAATAFAQGKVEEALAKLEAARAQIESHDVLAPRTEDLLRMELRIRQELGTTQAEQARYSDAASMLRAAARVADVLGKKQPRDELTQLAEDADRLASFETILDAAPRTILQGLHDHPSSFRSAVWLKARSWIALGFLVRGRRVLKEFLSASPDDDLAQTARSLLANLE
ncbi:MAG TPA: serine/threonine protein kinase [Planctomycetes bacterium]|nr:serine/threonine protein kinase [Planctomycetota bacterium]